MPTDNIKFALEFEKPVIDLEKKITEMKEYASSTGVDLGDDVKRLEKKAEQLRKEIYNNLDRWQHVQLARHPQRPYTLDYIERICQFSSIHCKSLLMLELVRCSHFFHLMI